MTGRIPMIVIAGTGSGVGKTSLALGIVASLKRRGLKAQTFKVGPDYLDPTYLALASGRPCYNLDGWMTSRDYVEQLAAEKVQDADAAVVEGVMGLYDGANAADSVGSTAQIARWLGAPVLLVVNAHGTARSFAAVVHGFATFHDAPPLAGVIANHAGSSRHVESIRQALTEAGLPPLVGAFQRNGLPQLSGRHLGLMTADDRTLPDATLSELANACDRNIAFDSILSWKWNPSARATRPKRATTPMRVGVAMDEAFHFYYRDNMELLEQAGVAWVPFSPIRDRELPLDLHALWLGGGYPEEHAPELSGNEEMLCSIRKFVNDGHPVYAECGGLMYLAESLSDRAGKTWAMAGALPARVRMLPRLERLGYAAMNLRAKCLFGAPGESLRGHEFHYSEIEDGATPEGWRRAYDIADRDGTTRQEGFWNGHVLASYVHVHLGSNPAAAGAFVAFLRGIQADRP
ncbi:MAG: cobyrinate a,c-diamide synthase [Verrucomicrobiota bacterium]|nr:cobyrinate a,c-diamide synthase [Verrucomicrobiota bacterium]